jgi:hypothetical protein
MGPIRYGQEIASETNEMAMNQVIVAKEKKLELLTKRLYTSLKMTRECVKGIKILFFALCFEPREWTDSICTIRNLMLATSSNGSLVLRDKYQNTNLCILTESLTPEDTLSIAFRVLDLLNQGTLKILKIKE